MARKVERREKRDAREWGEEAKMPSGRPTKKSGRTCGGVEVEVDELSGPRRSSVFPAVA
jgi:hypothetical protein